ncbi:MAG: sterol desaturase family protein [Burkholderiales bacterium]|nr:sterol desaturase family protein [Burkholderiales bacterium]
MPTPLDVLLDPITLTMLAMFAALALAERLFPGRPLPSVRGWHLRALAVFAVYVLLSSYLPLLWSGALAPLQVFDLSGWPAWSAVALGLLGYELLAYAYHRGMHAVDAWFRVSHQMHHSAERLDVYGAFWFSPLDIVGWTLVPSVALTLLGLPPAAATTTILVITFLAIFQHANLRTPRWLGYVVQRPESHTIHHARGIHAKNYADLPLIDMLFGTFENPRRFEHATGFWHGASARVLDMLLARDVSRPAPDHP